VVVRLDELRKELMRRVLPAVLFLVVACADGQAATKSVPHAAVVDSISDPLTALPVFLEGLERPEHLAGGAANPHELVERFFDALSRSDTAAVSSMIVTRAEYGFLYYATSVYAKKPYELPPDIAWTLSSEASAKAARRLLARLGGHAMDLERIECERIEHEGENEIRSGCAVTYVATSGDRMKQRLFRSMIIRDGRAKFLSYSGDF
jgi:hypothetical protein